MDSTDVCRFRAWTRGHIHVFVRGHGARRAGSLATARRVSPFAGCHPERPSLHLLRRAAIRHRPAPPRPLGGVGAQGRGAPLLDDERPPCVAPVRVGLPRPAHRAGNRQVARHVRQGGRGQTRRGRLQRRVPRHRGTACRRLAPHHHPPRPLGGFRRRLQDHGRLLHGVRLVGGEAPLGQGPRLSGLQGDAGVPGLGNRAGQFRGRTELHRRAGSGRHRVVSLARRRRPPGGVDDHAVDVAVQPGGLRPRRHGLCEGRGFRCE